MDLDEYLWRNKILKKDFAQKVGLTPHALSSIVARKVSAKLHTAINIVEATEGQVTYRDLLRPEDVELVVKGQNVQKRVTSKTYFRYKEKSDL